MKTNLLLKILIFHRNSPMLSTYHIYIAHQNVVFIRTIWAFVYLRIKTLRCRCNSVMAIAHDMVCISFVYGEIKSYKEK